MNTKHELHVPSHRSAQSERGIAMIVALLAMSLMLALGTSLMLSTMTETKIVTNYRSNSESLYAADAAIERALDDLLIGLRGDRVLASRNEPTPMSTSDRVDAIVGTQWSATVAPTGTSRKAYTDAADAFEKQLATLRTLVETDLAALEAAMEKAGAPWTPGRVPTWVKE